MVILGFVGAGIGRDKGLAGPGFLLGFFLGLIGLVVIAVLQPSQERLDRASRERGMMRCPHCKEFMRQGATVCHYCQREISFVETPVDEGALDRAWERYSWE